MAQVQQVRGNTTITDADRMQARIAELEAANKALADQSTKGRADPVNVETRIEGTKLHVVMDLAQSHGPSTTGLTTKVASTSGNRPFTITMPDGSQRTVLVGVNAYTKVPK